MSVIERDHVQKARDALDVALRSHDQSPRLYRGAMRAAMEDLDAALAAARGAVEAFAQERQAVLDVINLYGDETLHKALDDIGWPVDYVGGR